MNRNDSEAAFEAQHLAAVVNIGERALARVRKSLDLINDTLLECIALESPEESSGRSGELTSGVNREAKSLATSTCS